MICILITILWFSYLIKIILLVTYHISNLNSWKCMINFESLNNCLIKSNQIINYEIKVQIIGTKMPPKKKKRKPYMV